MAFVSPALSPGEVRALLARSGPYAVALDLLPRDPAQVSDLLSFLDREGRLQVLAVLPRHLAAQVLLRATQALRDELLGRLAARRLAELLDCLPADCSATLFEQLPLCRQKAVREGLSPATALQIDAVRRRPHGTVARLMIHDVARLDPDDSVADVLRSLRHGRVDPRALLQLYLVDEEDRLCGAVMLRQLLSVHRRTRVGDLASTACPTVTPSTLLTQAVRLMVRYRLHALPVVDGEGHVLASVTLRTILQHRALAGREPRLGPAPPAAVNPVARDRGLLVWLRWLVARALRHPAPASAGLLASAAGRSATVANREGRAKP